MYVQRIDLDPCSALATQLLLVPNARPNFISAQVCRHILLEGNPRRPDLFLTFLILGLSAVHPVFEDVRYNRIQADWGNRVSPLLQSPSRCLLCMYSLAPSRAWTSVHCLDAGVVTPRTLDTSLLVVTL